MGPPDPSTTPESPLYALVELDRGTGCLILITRLGPAFIHGRSPAGVRIVAPRTRVEWRTRDQIPRRILSAFDAMSRA
jgi:hypothetical protein